MYNQHVQGKLKFLDILQ